MSWRKRFKQGVTFQLLYLFRQELRDMLDSPLDDTMLTDEEHDALHEVYVTLTPIVERLAEEGRV